ncbi:hypothetical protein TCE0_034f12033, partial [Talaromyces pinophilus]
LNSVLWDPELLWMRSRTLCLAHTATDSRSQPVGTVVVAHGSQAINEQIELGKLQHVMTLEKLSRPEDSPRTIRWGRN